ncbi:MAG TPA: hypothetical protein VKZ78_09250 [Sphingobacteriaceae bacterium]|nr:hypothetical protein [Sphingobacteriaceae bacterium]
MSRREAGSYGAHVRGLNRLHQFDKVEVVQIVHPEHSYQVLEEMSLYVQSLLQALEDLTLNAESGFKTGYRFQKAVPGLKHRLWNIIIICLQTKRDAQKPV